MFDIPPLKITRQQLARFLLDERTIRAFEALFTDATVLLPANVTLLQTTVEQMGQVVGNNSTQGQLALSLLSQLESQLGEAIEGTNQTDLASRVDILDEQVHDLLIAPVGESSFTINDVNISLGQSVTLTATASFPLTIGTGLTGGSYDGSAAVTIALAIPVSIADGGTGQVTKTAAFDALSPTTTSGDLIYSNGTNNVRLPTATGVLVGGTPPTYSTAPTVSGTNFTAIPNGALVNSTVTINGTAVSLGASITITAVAPNALTIGTGLTGASYNGSTPVTIALSSPVSQANGGTGQTTKTAAFDALSPTTTAGDLIYNNGTNNVRLAVGSGVLVGGSTPAYSSSPSLSGANFSSIPNAALTNSAVTINGSAVSLGSSITVSAAPSGSASGDLSGTYPSPTVAKINGVSLGSTTATDGNLLIASGTAWVSTAMSGNVTINSSGVTAIAALAVTNAMLAGLIDLTAKVTGVLPVLNGGSGQSSYTNGQLLIGNATGNTLNKATLTAGSGITITNGGGSITVAQTTAPVTSITGTASQVLANGTSGSAQSGAVTLTTPQNIDSAASPTFSNVNLTNNILDSVNTAILLAFTHGITSPVNYFNITNNSTGKNPTIQSIGGDTNVGLTIQTKGTGVITMISNAPIVPITWFTGTSAQHTTNWSPPNTPTSHTITLQDANGTMAYLTDVAASGTVNSGTANQLAYYASSGTAVSGLTIVPVGSGGTGQSSYTNGQLLIGNTTGNTLTLSTLTGTASQVNVTNGSGSITLSTPQNIDTSSAPQFAGISFNTTQGIVGSTTNDTADAGSVGEFISSNVAIGSAVSLTSGAATNVTSISLTGGDWDIFGNVWITPAATTTITRIDSAISTTSATLPAANGPGSGSQSRLQVAFTTGAIQGMGGLYRRQSVAAGSSPLTVYLIALSTFSVSTNAAYGFIGARRRR